MNRRVPDPLRGLAGGDILLSHEAFDSLPRSKKSSTYTAFSPPMACLPWRDEHLIAHDGWLASELDAITDADQRQLLERYTRRHVTRPLRDSSTQAPVTANSFLHVKQQTTLAIRFLQWPTDRGRQLNSSPSTMSTPGSAAAAPAPAATPTPFSTGPSSKGWPAKSQPPGNHTATAHWPARRTTSKRFALPFSTRLCPPHTGPSASWSSCSGSRSPGSSPCAWTSSTKVEKGYRPNSARTGRTSRSLPQPNTPVPTTSPTCHYVGHHAPTISHRNIGASLLRLVSWSKTLSRTGEGKKQGTAAEQPTSIDFAERVLVVPHLRRYLRGHAATAGISVDAVRREVGDRSRCRGRCQGHQNVRAHSARESVCGSSTEVGPKCLTALEPTVANSPLPDPVLCEELSHLTRVTEIKLVHELHDQALAGSLSNQTVRGIKSFSNHSDFLPARQKTSRPLFDATRPRDQRFSPTDAPMRCTFASWSDRHAPTHLCRISTLISINERHLRGSLPHAA